MDFMMNGPRIQLNLFDGYEECTPLGATQGNFLGFAGGGHRGAISNIYNLYPVWNDIYIHTDYYGRQKVASFWQRPNGTVNATAYPVSIRYALRTTMPGWYLIVSKTRFGSSYPTVFHYVKTGIYDTASSLTGVILTVELPRSIWKNYSDSTITPTAISRIGINGANVNLRDFYVNDDTTTYTGTGGYLTKTVDADTITYKVEFPSAYWSLQARNANAFMELPNNLAGKKMGTPGDRVSPGSDQISATGGWCVEVFSPIKNCMCLKTYLNGEIPILN